MKLLAKIFLFLFLINCASAQSLPLTVERLMAKVTDKTIPVEERKAILEKFEDLKLDPTPSDYEKLASSLINCDVNLLPDIFSLFDRSNYTDNVNRIIGGIIDNRLDDPRFVAVLLSESLQTCPDKYEAELNKKIFELIRKSDAYVIEFIKLHPNFSRNFEDIFYLVDKPEVEFGDFINRIVKLTKGGDELYAIASLEYVGARHLSCFINEGSLKHLVELTHSSNSEIFRLSSNILFNVTHYELKGEEKWRDWEKTKGQNFSIIKASLPIFLNFKLQDREKGYVDESTDHAASQIYFSLLAGNFLSKEEKRTIVSTFQNDKYKPIRPYCITMLIASQVDKSVFDAETDDMINELIKNKAESKLIFKSNYPMTLTSVVAFKRKLLSIIESEQYDLGTKVLAVNTLREVRKGKKLVANIILTLWKHNFDKLNSKGEDSKKILNALIKITGKDCKSDLSAWQKSISEMPDDPPAEKPEGGKK